MEPPPRTESMVRAYQGGADPSFVALYERLAPALYAWAVLRAPRGLEPADLLAEIWLHAVRRLSTYEEQRASFRAWIFGIAKKLLLRELRALDRRSRLVENGAEGVPGIDLERVPEAVTSLSRRFERDESLLEFLARVNGLGREEREMVVYCGLEGFSCGEAAQRMGLTEAATTKRWQRLRAELRSATWAEDLLV